MAAGGRIASDIEQALAERDEAETERASRQILKQVHKAFVLPQQDPGYYDTFIDTYNVVELVKSRVNVSTFKLAQAMQKPPLEARFQDRPQVDAYTGPTKTHEAGY